MRVEPPQWARKRLMTMYGLVFRNSELHLFCEHLLTIMRMPRMAKRVQDNNAGDKEKVRSGTIIVVERNKDEVLRGQRVLPGKGSGRPWSGNLPGGVRRHKNRKVRGTNRSPLP